MTRDEDALRMLAEVKTANAEMAERAKAPVWYHPALGLLMGGLVAVQGQPFAFLIAYYIAFAAGLALLVRAYKRHTGLWINGYRAGRTRWVAVGLAVLSTIAMLISVSLQREHGVALAPLAFGGIIAVIVTIGGFIWEAAFRADLKDGGSL